MAVDEQYAQTLRENEKQRAAFADIETVRDRIAIAVLPQFLELEVTGVWNQSLGDGVVSKRDHARQVACAAYYMADAMLAERAAHGVAAAPAPTDLRARIAPLLNEFGMRQWQSGRGVPHKSLEEAFEAVLAAAGVSVPDDQTFPPSDADAESPARGGRQG